MSNKETQNGAATAEGLLGQNDQTHHQMDSILWIPHHQPIGVPKNASNYKTATSSHQTDHQKDFTPNKHMPEHQPRPKQEAS